MNKEEVIIKSLQITDIEEAMKLVLDESWNQTEKDWELFIGNSRNVCLKAEIGGRLVGTAAAINYAGQQAWIGMVLVNKAHRGKGIAKLLMNTILAELKSLPSVKLDATPAGERVYEKIGFVGEYSIDRMINPTSDLDLKIDSELVPVKISEADYQDIIEFDKNAFGVRRDNLLGYLSKDFPQAGWMVKQDNKLVGFVLGRQGNKHFQIGPVSAKNPEIAKNLIIQAIKEIDGQSLVIDVLSDKTELVEWLESIGFAKKRDFIRMYRHSNPFPGKPEWQYLICGPEFG